MSNDGKEQRSYNERTGRWRHVDRDGNLSRDEYDYPHDDRWYLDRDGNLSRNEYDPHDDRRHSDRRRGYGRRPDGEDGALASLFKRFFG